MKATNLLTYLIRVEYSSIEPPALVLSRMLLLSSSHVLQPDFVRNLAIRHLVLLRRAPTFPILCSLRPCEASLLGTVARLAVATGGMAVLMQSDVR